jgi:pimeloyl-ACP methyl ester carboxylesterase
MKKKIGILAALGLFLGLVYFLGPKPPKAMLTPQLPNMNTNLEELEREIQSRESAVADLKSDNQARIVWADSNRKEKTRYSFVYIHGFGASWAEGEPVHRRLAARYGANLYLSRMEDAGISNPDAYQNLTPKSFLEGAKRALAIGKALGEEVILIGTSAGGLLSVYLASTNPDLKGLILYSPCMDIYNSALKVATGPWGAEAVQKIVGDRMLNEYTPERQKYWMSSYSSKGLITLQATIDAVAKPEVYQKIKMPVFLGYYYKNDEEQDKTVSVKAMKEMFPLLATPPALKRERAFPQSGHHVIGSYMTSGDVEGVVEESQKFVEEILQIAPASIAESPVQETALER